MMRFLSLLLTTALLLSLTGCESATSLKNGFGTVVDEIVEAYKHLCIQYGENTDVAVRSSATAEDLPDASFAGQQDTYLNIKGNRQLIDACRRCIASLFTNRAISYRVDKHFDHFSIALSIGVQKWLEVISHLVG